MDKVDQVSICHNKSWAQVYSLKSSISAGIDGLSAGMESTFTLSAQVETSISSSEEKFWPKEVKKKYTAPAGKFIEMCKHCWIFLALWM